MSQFAAIVACLALAGAVASWIVGGWSYAAMARVGGGRAHWLAVIGWPFARSRVNADATQSAQLNKALVAFIACLTVAAAATSVATNLARVSR